MLIETDPCKDCDFSPEYCSCDIDICQITKGKSKPVSEEQYEMEKLRRYEKNELNAPKDMLYDEIYKLPSEEEREKAKKKYRSLRARCGTIE